MQARAMTAVAAVALAIGAGGGFVLGRKLRPGNELLIGDSWDGPYDKVAYGFELNLDMRRKTLHDQAPCYVWHQYDQGYGLFDSFKDDERTLNWWIIQFDAYETRFSKRYDKIAKDMNALKAEATAIAKSQDPETCMRAK